MLGGIKLEVGIDVKNLNQAAHPGKNTRSAFRTSE